MGTSRSAHRCIIYAEVNNARGARITGCDIRDTQHSGVWAAEVKLTDSVVAGNSVGIDAREHVIVRGSDVSGNTGKGIAAWGNRRIKLLDSVVSSNGEHGVYVYRAATIKRSMLQNNGKNGILVYGFGYKNHLAISDSTLTGNGTSAECETTVVCADIATGDFPRLKRAICETSYQRDSDPPKSWGICSLD